MEYDYPKDVTIGDYFFKMTCGACPEQYDVYKNGKQVAYVRLRWGFLNVTVPDVGGRSVYSYDFSDDEHMGGLFSNQEERMYHLRKIAEAICMSDFSVPAKEHSVLYPVIPD